MHASSFTITQFPGQDIKLQFEFNPSESNVVFKVQDENNTLIIERHFPNSDPEHLPKPNPNQPQLYKITARDVVDNFIEGDMTIDGRSKFSIVFGNAFAALRIIYTASRKKPVSPTDKG